MLSKKKRQALKRFREIPNASNETRLLKISEKKNKFFC